MTPELFVFSTGPTHQRFVPAIRVEDPKFRTRRAELVEPGLVQVIDTGISRGIRPGHPDLDDRVIEIGKLSNVVD